MAKRGRPSKYTPEIAEEICNRLATGESLRSICRDEGMPDESRVRRWAIEDYNGFFAAYSHARDIGLDCRADQLLDDAADSSNDMMRLGDKVMPNNVAVNRAKLIVDTGKWYLGVMAPKRYSTRLAHELSGPEGGPIEVDNKELARRVALMLEQASDTAANAKLIEGTIEED